MSVFRWRHCGGKETRSILVGQSTQEVPIGGRGGGSWGILVETLF